MPAAADSSPNSVTWSCPSALVGNRNSARDRRIVGDGLEHGHRVAQRLARRRRGDDHDVLAGVDRLHRLGLVDVRPVDAARRQARHDPAVQPGRKGPECRRPCRDDRVMDDAPGQRRLGQQVREDGLRAGGGVGAHRTASNSTDVRFPRV